MDASWRRPTGIRTVCCRNDRLRRQRQRQRLRLPAITGAQVWEGSAGAAVARPDEHNGFVLQGIQIADGLLAVPATSRMTVFG